MNQNSIIEKDDILPPNVQAVDNEIRGSLMNNPELNIDDI